jgi:radical SAM superfamily enzyme YgiQ (UPF0313 family)
MDVALLFPPGWDTPQPPLGLACLASYLRAHGIKVRLYDLNQVAQTEPEKLTLAISETIAAIKDSGAKVAGLSMAYPNFHAGLSLAREIKRQAPGTVIVAGGPQISFLRERLVKNYGDAFDLLVYSEGEIPFLQVVNRIFNGSRYERIAGTRRPWRATSRRIIFSLTMMVLCIPAACYPKRGRTNGETSGTENLREFFNSQPWQDKAFDLESYKQCRLSCAEIGAGSPLLQFPVRAWLRVRHELLFQRT